MKRLLVILLFLVLNAAPALSAPDVQVDIKGPGTVKMAGETAHIEAAVGSDVTVTLASNPTTGYSWQLSEVPVAGLLRLIGHRFERPETAMLGAGGRDIWIFKAVGVGQTQGVLEYARPWEKEKAPAKRLMIRATIIP